MWAEVKDTLHACDDDAVKLCAIEDLLFVFLNLCQKHIVFRNFPSYEPRRKDLEMGGFTFGSVSGHGCNCVAVFSLLQLLSQ